MKSKTFAATSRQPWQRQRRSRTLWLLCGMAGAIALLLASGCSTTNLAEVIKASAQDTNSLQVTIRGPLWTADVKRGP